MRDLIKRIVWGTLSLATITVSGYSNPILTKEFVDYHLKLATDEIEDEAIFQLIQENINQLKNRQTSTDSTNELIYLIEEGYKIDPFNMAKLIETLTYKDASYPASLVLVAAIKHNSPLNSDHIYQLIQTLTHAEGTNQATTVILTAIECGIKFGLKERIQLTEVSKVAHARKNVKKIRRALHEKEINS